MFSNKSVPQTGIYFQWDINIFSSFTPNKPVKFDEPAIWWSKIKWKNKLYMPKMVTNSINHLHIIQEVTHLVSKAIAKRKQDYYKKSALKETHTLQAY